MRSQFLFDPASSALARSLLLCITLYRGRQKNILDQLLGVVGKQSSMRSVQHAVFVVVGKQSSMRSLAHASMDSDPFQLSAMLGNPKQQMHGIKLSEVHPARLMLSLVTYTATQ